ncbi:MAG: EamA family transporter [Anaerolineales bacterium]
MKIRIGLALFAIYVIWGSTYLAISLAVQTIPPFLMAATRFLIAGAILYSWQRVRGVPFPPRVEWRSAAIIAGFMLVGGNGALTWAEQQVPSSIAALVITSVPLWMALIDALVIPGEGKSSRPLAFLQKVGKPLVGGPARQRPGALTWVGLLAGFAGILMLIQPWEQDLQARIIAPLGLTVLLLASLSWSIGSLYSRGARLPAAPLMGTGIEMLLASLGFLVLATLGGEWNRVDLSAISTESWLSLSYLVVFGGLIGFVAYTWLLRNAPTPLVSAHAYINPLIAILLGSLLANEPLTPETLVAAVVIVASVALITVSRAFPFKKKKAPILEPAVDGD